MILLNNQKRFVSNDYSNDGPIVKEAIFDFYQFEQTPFSQELHIQKTEIESDDNLFLALDSVTARDDFAFHLEQKGKGRT